MPTIQHTTKKHKIQAIIIIVIALSIYLGGAIFSGYYFGKKRVKIDETNFDPSLMDASIRPEGEGLTGIVIPDADDKAAQIALAVQLITIANQNLKNDDKVAYSVVSNTKVMGVATGGRRYYIKNDDEFFNADYFFVPKDGLGEFAKAADPDNTNYGYRKYFNTTLNVGYEQKSVELDFKKKGDNVLFGVNWSVLRFENKITEIPAEFAASDKPYRYYNYDWTEDSLLSASVTYNAEEGYYEIIAKIDTQEEDAIKDGLEVLRTGAGDEDARYTSIKETVQIWDNGRYKMFNTYDDWESPHIYGLPTRKPTKSANDYKTTFYYDDYSLNISNYQYADDFINYIKSK